MEEEDMYMEEEDMYRKSTIWVWIGIIALSCMFLLGQDDWTTRQREACCFGDGTCAFTYPDSCDNMGGTLQGPGTDCSTNPCPQPQEACCMPDGTCEDVTVGECTGDPQGPDTDCATADCPQPDLTGSWQPASGAEAVTGFCDRPPQLQGGLVTPDPILVTTYEDDSHRFELPNGCGAVFQSNPDGSISFVSGETCDVFYQVAPASMTITGGSVALRGEDVDEANFSMSYTVTQYLAGPPPALPSLCDLTLFFVQLTQDPDPAGPEPIDTIASFLPGTFVESVERDAAGNTWVMAVNYLGTGASNGVYKIPDSDVPLDVTPANEATYRLSAWPHGFGGNIVFDGDRLLATYSDSENTDPGTLVRQVVEIDTSTGALTTVVDLAPSFPDSTPNGITLDTDGNIYIADSGISRILRVPAGTTTPELWAEGGLLSPTPGLPGVNGIKVFEGSVYVSNSATLMMVKIPIQPDGSAGPPQPITTNPAFPTGVIGDDFSLDVDGNVWVTTHPMNGLVLLRPDGTARLIRDSEEGVWGPTSAVFGVAPGDTTTLYMVNDGNAFAAVGFPPWMQQSAALFPATVQRLDVGVAGAPVPGSPIPTTDTDGDGILDFNDNCPADPNPGQEDMDSDGAGDVCDPCPDDPADGCVDRDGDGVTDSIDNCPDDANADQADEDADGVGDVCDPCIGDPDNVCDSPALISAALLDPTGCETYIGPHPTVPGQSLCGTGGDELCVVEYVFCDDGTAEKRWDPAPGDPMAGGLSDGSGTWSYAGNTLTINTAAPGSFGTTTTVETYGVAFTYDDGGTQKLDWSSVAQTSPGDGSSIVGTYGSQATTTLTIPGGIINVNANTTRVLDVSAGINAPWTQTETKVVTCTGLGCGSVQTGTTVTETSGTIPWPGELFDLGTAKILQVDPAPVLVKQ
jgi:sugar lactone lactonase YvrE